MARDSREAFRSWVLFAKDWQRFTFQNGYYIQTVKTYDGYNTQRAYGVYTPKEELYMSCQNGHEAYELASHLVYREEDRILEAGRGYYNMDIEY